MNGASLNGASLNIATLNVEEAIRLLRSSMPDGKVIATLNVEEAIRLLRSSMPDGKVVLVVENSVPANGKPAATASDSTTLITSKKNNNVDATENSPTSSHRRGTTYEAAKLSPRECVVLACLAQGNSNKAIARIYNLSVATVKVHLKAILCKTKTHNRTQAVIWAIENGLRDKLSKHRSIGSGASDLPTKGAKQDGRPAAGSGGRAWALDGDRADA